MDKHFRVDIYILEAYDTHFSGYKTFQEEFLKGLVQCDRFKLHIIIEDYLITSAKKKIENSISYIYIPKIIQNKFETLEYYLKTTIEDTPKMVFFSNFLPAIFNVKAIKKLFPHAKIIHIIHDFPWLSIFSGNEVRYMDYIQNREKQHILCPRDDKFVRYCTYDIVESFDSIDIIVSLCKSTYCMLKDFYEVDKKKIRLIPNGMKDYSVRNLNSEHFYIKQKYGIPESGLLILVVGRLTHSKGADRIVKLLNRIDASIKYYLIYVGEDDIYKWMPLEMANSIISLGFKSRLDMFEIYSVCNLGVFPSRFEQCSYAGIEFLMYGIPVITTPSYGVRDMFNSENSFVIPDYQDVISLEDIETKKRSARDFYLKNYTSERMINDYISLIVELVGN